MIRRESGGAIGHDGGARGSRERGGHQVCRLPNQAREW